MSRRSLLFAAVLLAQLPSAVDAAAPIAVVPATSRKDVVFDRYDVLYISNADRLIRYDAGHRALLPDLVVPGAKLVGMDIDSSSCRIAVADLNQVDAQTSRILLVNNGATAATPVPLALDFGEGGTFDVAFSGPRSVYVSSNYNGSGWVPFRRVSLPDGTAQILGGVTQRTMIATSHDGRYYAYSEGNISSGPVVLGDTATDGILSSIQTQKFMFEISISPDGSVITAPSYNGTFVFDRVGSQLSQRPALIGSSATWGTLSMSFATHTPVVFATLWGSGSDPHGVVVYPDSGFTAPTTLDPVAFDFASYGSFDIGRLTLSPDGRYLAVTIPNAVAVYDISAYAADAIALFDDGLEDGCEPF